MGNLNNLLTGDGVRLELKARRDLREVINSCVFLKDSFSLFFIVILIILTDSISKLMTKSLKVSFIQKKAGASHESAGQPLGLQ